MKFALIAHDNKKADNTPLLHTPAYMDTNAYGIMCVLFTILYGRTYGVPYNKGLHICIQPQYFVDGPRGYTSTISPTYAFRSSNLYLIFTLLFTIYTNPVNDLVPILSTDK
jgi:hypothetical protein